MANIVTKINSLSFEQLKAIGLIDELKLRNYLVRAEWDEMRLAGYKILDIEIALGDKYFLSPESIHRIRYDREYRTQFVLNRE